MTQPWDETEQPIPASAGHTEILGGPVGDIVGNEPPARSRRRPLIAAVAGVAAVALIGGGAAVAAGAFDRDGGQPDQLVPASAVAYFSLDLDPSLGQKVDALRFLRRFPSAKASLGSSDDLREWVFDQVTEDDADLSSLDYGRDIKPWLGNRFGVAIVPGAAANAGPAALVVVQVTDTGRAQAGLKKLLSGRAKGTCSVSGGYAVCAQTPAILAAARSAAANHSLADNTTFSHDVARAGSRGIALAWGDEGKLFKAIPGGLAGLSALGAEVGGSASGDSSGEGSGEGSGDGLASPLGGIGGFGALGSLGLGADAARGRFVAVVRFNGPNLELTGRGIDGASTGASATPGTGVENLPDGSIAALGLATAPGSIDTSYRQLMRRLDSGVGSGSNPVQSGLDSLGFHLPQDLDAIVGTKLAVAYGGQGPDGQPLVGVRGNAPADRAGAVVDKINALLSFSGRPYLLEHVAAGDGYAAALSRDYATQLATGGHLGRSSRFRAAVPDAGTADGVAYVDVTSLLHSGLLSGADLGATDRANLAAVDAVGVSTTVAGDGSSTLRLELLTR